MAHRKAVDVELSGSLSRRMLLTDARFSPGNVASIVVRAGCDAVWFPRFETSSRSRRSIMVHSMQTIVELSVYNLLG